MKRGGQVSGVVSLVMIFCSLCLCVFAVLTFASADRERVMCEMTARSAGEYYAADYEAVKEAAAVKAKGLSAGESVVIEKPVGADQTLVAEIRGTDTGARVVRWQTVFTGDWETEDTIQVWDGN